MNFSRRSFASFASRRPRWPVETRLRRSAMPTTPSPFFRPAAAGPQASLKIEASTQPSLRAA